MLKILKGKGGLNLVIAGTLVMLLIYPNRNMFRYSTSPKVRLFIETFKGDVKGGYVLKDITKFRTTVLYTCTKFNMPVLDKKLKMIDGYWQPLNINLSAFVFSAYLIYERKKIVVIAMIRNVKNELYFCQFWHKGENSQYILSYQTHAEVIRLPEDHGRTYSAALFECSLHTSPPDSLPFYVSIVDRKCTSPLNIMIAQHVTNPEAFSRNFTVCLSPLHTKIDLYRFIEWIELNRILGADMFFVYRNTDDINLNKILDFYSKKGFIKIMHWNLPDGKNLADGSKSLSVHYFGQVAALNDCLYRNKYESEYIVNIDLDEYIIPHIENETTWRQMLSHVKETGVGYIVRHTLFKMKEDTLNPKFSNKTLVEKYKLITLRKVQREENLSSARHRSKYFTRTSRVHFVQIHGVPGINKLPINLGLLHHYREKNKNATMSHLITDRTIPDKFGDILIKKVTNIWTEINRNLSDNVQ